MKQFVHEFKVYRPGDQTNLKADCNDIALYNTGAANIVINGYTLVPAQSIQLGAQADELNVTIFQWSFASVAATEGLLIIKKLYK